MDELKEVYCLTLSSTYPVISSKFLYFRHYPERYKIQAYLQLRKSDYAKVSKIYMLNDENIIYED